MEKQSLKKKMKRKRSLTSEGRRSLEFLNTGSLPILSLVLKYHNLHTRSSSPLTRLSSSLTGCEGTSGGDSFPQSSPSFPPSACVPLSPASIFGSSFIGQSQGLNTGEGRVDRCGRTDGRTDGWRGSRSAGGRSSPFFDLAAGKRFFLSCHHRLFSLLPCFLSLHRAATSSCPLWAPPAPQGSRC